jgi:hypothetical protein
MHRHAPRSAAKRTRVFIRVQTLSEEDKRGKFPSRIYLKKDYWLRKENRGYVFTPCQKHFLGIFLDKGNNRRR